MKKLLLITSVLIMGGCSTLGLKQPNCYESVAISKIALTEAYQSAANLSEGEMISINTAEDVLMILDRADQTVDSASAYCAIDKVAARDLLKTAQELLGVATAKMETADE